MKGLKKGFIALAIMGVIGFSGLHCFAQTGVVDIDKITANYTKFQDYSADMESKEADLEKFVADNNKAIKDAKTPLEKNSLIEKAQKEYDQKFQAIKETQNKQIKEFQESLTTAVSQAAALKNIDLVLYKSNVLYGGVDITDSVLQALNKK